MLALILFGAFGFFALGAALAHGAVEYLEQRKFDRAHARRMAQIEEARKRYWGE